MNRVENPTLAARGFVLAMIEPSGPKTNGRCAHVLHLRLEMSAADIKRGGTAYVTSLAREALTGFVDGGECTFAEVPAKKPGGKITAIEGTLALSARPGDDAFGHLSATLRVAGYNVTIQETRECEEAGCSSRVAIAWNRPSSIPSGWYDRTICGKHGYKRCSGCSSTYAMSSSNASGQAPSLHCEICGTILVEWGGTKVWVAELVGKTVASE
jgi:hypothetical protein